MAIPDGRPLSIIGYIRGFKNMKRVTGPDYMEEIFKLSVAEGYRHYFYGTTDETLEKLRTRLTQKYRGINIVGMYAPPFRDMTEEEDKVAVQRINDTSPDFVWIGLGGVKQEKYMWIHRRGVGA